MPTSREQLTLVMEDGRRLNFFVADGAGHVRVTSRISAPEH